MVQGNEALQKARVLAEKVHAIPEMNLPAFQSPSSAETALLDLRKHAAELVNCLQRGSSLAEKHEVLTKLEGAFQVAQLLGIVSERELESYRSDIDGIVNIIDAK